MRFVVCTAACQAVGGKGQINGLPEARPRGKRLKRRAKLSCQRSAFSGQEDSDTQKALLDCLVFGWRNQDQREREQREDPLGSSKRLASKKSEKYTLRHL